VSLRIDRPRTPRPTTFRGSDGTGRIYRFDGPGLTNVLHLPPPRGNSSPESCSRHDALSRVPMTAAEPRGESFISRAANWLVMSGGMSIVLLLGLTLLGLVGSFLSRL
jgi:hypothetical protein